MSNIYTNTKGVVLYINTGYNLSSATSLGVHFSAPSQGGTSFVNSVSTSALGANYTTSAGLVMSANNTLLYTINSADFSMDASAAPNGGTWKCWVEAEFGAAVRLVSSSFKFQVRQPG
jgi:hypothetical protein